MCVLPANDFPHLTIRRAIGTPEAHAEDMLRLATTSARDVYIRAHVGELSASSACTRYEIREFP